ncbi:MAG: hypothetical protein ACOY3P_04310, partial [Planctomycetota bacterium]
MADRRRLDPPHGSSQGFNYTSAMRALCEDFIARLEELRHVDLARVGLGFIQARNNSRLGLYASVTPLRFAGGRTHVTRRGKRFGLQRVYLSNGTECLYLLNFYLPRFQDLPLREALDTVAHELWHIGPKFDGDVRRFAGRCYAHSGSKDSYDAHAAKMVDRWLALRPPPGLYSFLEPSFAELQARYGP